MRRRYGIESARASEGGRITALLLKQKSGEFDLESIFRLDLSKLDLDDAGSIGECTSLERLNLSGNRLQKLYALSSLLSLTWLDLSANSVQFVDGLQTLEKLKYLNLAGNLIQNVESLNCLYGLESLESLRLRDDVRGLNNPLCHSCTYKFDVTQNLPTLLELDGERLKGKGSDLFELLNSVSVTVGDARPKSRPGPLFRGSPLDGVSKDYFTETEFTDHVETLDAEKELNELLSECRRMQQNFSSENS